MSIPTIMRTSTQAPPTTQNSQKKIHWADSLALPSKGVEAASAEVPTFIKTSISKIKTQRLSTSKGVTNKRKNH